MSAVLAWTAEPAPSVADTGPPAGKDAASSDCSGWTPSDNQAVGPSFALPTWSDAAGWRSPSGYGTILTADFDGDGIAELLGRSAAGLEVWRFDTALGQWMPPRVGGRLRSPAGPVVGASRTPLSDAAGWDDPSRALTIQAANIDGQGGQEILARGADGVHVWTYRPAAGTWQELPAGPPLWDANKWNLPQYYRTITTGDVDGDGADDIVARGGGGVAVYRFDAAKGVWKAPLDGPSWSDDAGWNRPAWYETVGVGRLYGNGRVQLFGRTSAGMEAWDYDPATSRWTSTVPDAGDRWNDADPKRFDRPERYATIQAADVDGDGRDEIIGRSIGIGVLKYDPDKKAWVPLVDVGDVVMPDRPNDLPSYYETIQVYRPTQKGRPLLLLRGTDGIELYEFTINDSGNYAWVEAGTGPLPALSDANGWADASQALTIQTADVDGVKSVDGATTNEIVARDSVGVRTWTVQRDPKDRLLHWVPTTAQVPDYAAGAEAKALDSIEDDLGLGGDEHLRCQYGKPGNDRNLAAYLNDIVDDSKMPLPAGMDPTVWKQVRAQLAHELRTARSTQTFFDLASQQLEESALDQKLALDSVKSVLGLKDGDRVDAIFAGAFNGLVEGMIAAVPLGGALAEAGQLVVAGAVGGAMDTALGDELGGRLDSSYAGVETALSKHLTDSQAALRVNLSDAARDWGLLQALDQLETSGALSMTAAEQNATVASARRGYDAWLWQTLTPSTWEVVAIKCPNADQCRRDSNARYLYQADGRGYFLTVPDTFNPHEPNRDQEDHLFLPTDAGCLTRSYSWLWTGDQVQGCSLGASVAAVMLGLDGWRLPCSGDGCAVGSRSSASLRQR